MTASSGPGWRLLRLLGGSKHKGDAEPEQARPDPETYRLIYDEAVRAITHQRDALDELRARAGTLLAAVNIATAFLAGSSLANGQASAFGLAALVCFVVAVLLCIAVLWPSQLGVREQSGRPHPRLRRGRVAGDRGRDSP